MLPGWKCRRRRSDVKRENEKDAKQTKRVAIEIETLRLSKTMRVERRASSTVRVERHSEEYVRVST
jgi:hypothetical protein